ncbi:MAG: PQ-loop domain-containing transporter [Candidatus Pacearchaeota archaeon]|jgi:uncharacterized protein with PQ loop repeat
MCALHHISKRKRIHHNYEPYPHPNKWKRFLDIVIYFMGFASPVLTIPQILKIWIEKNSYSLSLVSWLTYLIGSIIFFLYALVHKEKPLIIIYLVSIIVNLAVVVSIILFR